MAEEAEPLPYGLLTRHGQPVAALLTAEGALLAQACYGGEVSFRSDPAAGPDW